MVRSMTSRTGNRLVRRQKPFKEQPPAQANLRNTPIVVAMVIDRCINRVNRIVRRNQVVREFVVR